MSKSKFTSICWLFLLHEWDMSKTKLNCLLYYSQAWHLVMMSRPLFSYPLYALDDGPGFQDEADELISQVLFTRDWINFWLGTAYCFVAYLAYFKAITQEPSESETPQTTIFS